MHWTTVFYLFLRWHFMINASKDTSLERCRPFALSKRRKTRASLYCWVHVGP
jgi:hypothetical protein